MWNEKLTLHLRCQGSKSGDFCMCADPFVVDMQCQLVNKFFGEVQYASQFSLQVNNVLVVGLWGQKILCIVLSLRLSLW